MQENVRKLLEKQGYRIIGGHSAVKTCHWLKESLVNNRPCYKEKFYGIKSHRCLQMTPSVAWCQHRCVFCWRPIEHTLGTEMKFETDEPNFIIENAIREQRRLISGYWGNEKVDEVKLKEAEDPRHAAISLAGEPTTYPMIGDLIEEFHGRGFTTYLVTNGINPKVLEEIEEPTQLYLSLEAYDRELYKRINNPQVKDGWERLNRSLEILNSITTKKVIRITLVRGFNLDKPKKFVPLIEKAHPDYVEPKGYVHVGYSRRRLLREDMPSFEEVQRFATALSEEIGYDIKDSSKDSKVVLLSK
ncbi:MAG: 4-demethylwyosine synthase TYW1 [Candidatus Hydrothermarchaeales archaeon]